MYAKPVLWMESFDPSMYINRLSEKFFKYPRVVVFIIM